MMLDAVGQAELAGALLALSETGLIALDQSRQVVVANPAARTLLGVSEPVVGQSVDALLRRVSALTPAAVASAEAWLAGPSDQPLFLPLDAETKVSVVAAAGPGGYRLLALKRQPRAAAPASRKDKLTGLSDRTWFHEQLAASLAEPGATPALLMLNLDRFRAVNDSLGHQTGDALLQLVAKRLTRALRNADAICRLFDDTFAVLMKRPSHPEMVGRRLVALLSRPYLIEGSAVAVGASIGLAMAPDHGRDVTTLIHAADAALGAAKRDGSGVARVFEGSAPE